MYELPKTVLEKGGIISIKPNGTSMNPFINCDKDTVIISSVLEKPKKRDVVLYTRKDGVKVLHRIIRVENDSYTMCGDNHLLLEKGIKYEQLIGKLIGIYREDKYIDVQKTWYKFKVFLWCIIPLRRFCLFIKRVKLKLNKKINNT